MHNNERDIMRCWLFVCVRVCVYLYVALGMLLQTINHLVPSNYSSDKTLDSYSLFLPLAPPACQFQNVWQIQNE